MYTYTGMCGLGWKAQLVRYLPCIDICNLGSGFLSADFMSFVQTPRTQGQNMRPIRLSNIYKSSMNTVIFVNYWFFRKSLLVF